MNDELNAFSSDVQFDVAEEAQEIAQGLTQADWFVKAESRDALMTALDNTDIVSEDEDGNKVLHSTKAIGVDEVGTIYAPTGNTLTDDEGNEYPEIAPVQGYHLNLRKMRDEADSIITILEDADLTIDPPATPHRKFA
jgi:predicted  nucleic acid-binding Zn-ribbon protein